MDATTILAMICSAVVLCGWLVLPHGPAKATRPVTTAIEREPAKLSA